MPKARSEGGITCATGIAMVTGFGFHGVGARVRDRLPFWILGSEAPRRARTAAAKRASRGLSDVLARVLG